MAISIVHEQVVGVSKVHRDTKLPLEACPNGSLPIFSESLFNCYSMNFKVLRMVISEDFIALKQLWKGDLANAREKLLILQELWALRNVAHVDISLFLQVFSNLQLFFIWHRSLTCNRDNVGNMEHLGHHFKGCL